MAVEDWTYVTLGINPFGGLLVAIPWGAFQCHYSWPVLFLSGPPLAYVQVLAVDLLWRRLEAIPGWRGFIERRRSPRVERLLASGGTFWPAFLLSPIVGAWLVMALMRYAQVPQRRVALPIFLSLIAVTTLLVGACVWAPSWFAASPTDAG